MEYLLLSLIVGTVLVFGVPYALKRERGIEPKGTWLLVTAAAVFWVSWYVPSPRVGGQVTQFTTHVVGGGLFAGFLWLYLKRNLRWRQSKVGEAWSLFAFVSALGVMVELAELAAVRFGLLNLTLEDTTWDLVANTLGAGMFYVGLLVARWKR